MVGAILRKLGLGYWFESACQYEVIGYEQLNEMTQTIPSLQLKFKRNIKQPIGEGNNILTHSSTGSGNILLTNVF